MKKTAIIAAMLLLGAARAGAQVDSSCLVLWQDSPLKPPDVVWFNSDSVKVDMCPGQEQYAEFAKNKYIAAFLYYIIPDSLAPTGDTLQRTWMDIDTSFSGIRKGFDSIEQLFGPFTLQHYDDGRGDTSTDMKAWFINFTRYLNVDTTVYYLSQLPELNFNLGPDFTGRPSFYEDVIPSNVSSAVAIWPQPCDQEFFVQGQGLSDKILFYDPLGRRVSLMVNALSDSLLIVDVSNVLSEVLYANISGQFFKILIQK